MIIPPEASAMRFGMDHFNELDLRAKDENWPPGWRMDHDDREANRQQILRGHEGRDLWVFAYGSLIWDPAVYVEEFRLGTVNGWQRRFCMKIESGRGTFDQPGLMAALDSGGACEGVVLRLSSTMLEQETRFMWNREMFSGSYSPIFVNAATPQGDVDALAFVMNRDNRRYVPHFSNGDAARMIATAEGTLGTNFEYLDALLRNLDRLGLKDDDMRDLHSAAAKCLGQDAAAQPG